MAQIAYPFRIHLSMAKKKSFFSRNLRFLPAPLIEFTHSMTTMHPKGAEE